MAAKYVVSDVTPPLVRGDYVKLHLCPSPSETRRRHRLAQQTGNLADRPACETVWATVTGKPSPRTRCYTGRIDHELISVDVGREPVRFCARHVLEHMSEYEARKRSKKKKQ